MAVAYERESGEKPNDAGIDAAYTEIINSVHKELEAFVTKYCPKKLNEFDDLMEQAFWQYH